MPDAWPEPAIASELPETLETGDVVVRRFHERDVAQGVALAAGQLAEATASEALLHQVRAHNPDSLWGMFRKDATDEAASMIGFCAFLILNDKGATALMRGTFDARRINFDLLAPTADTATVLYVWAILGKGVSGSITSFVNEVMVRRYRGRPLYTTAATEAGLRFMRNCGYIPIHKDCTGIGALHRRVGRRVDLPVLPKRAKRVLKVVPVTTADEFEKALVIRHLFLTEQACPYEEEFDGNDRTGTHFLGYVDGEPAATLRVRYFANFVKLERLAVLPRFRRTLIAKEIVLTAVNFCRRKGYRRCVGHAQRHLVKFWGKFGFKPTPRNLVFNFSERDYVEMYGDLEPDARALTIESDPYVIIRPEGRWDEPGILERSAERVALDPHRQEA